MRTAKLGGLPALLMAGGCVVWMREPDAYREELVELVATRDEPIKACYEDTLERRQLEVEAEERAAQGPYGDIGPAVSARVDKLQGDVVVDFTVAPQTGRITAAVDPKGTTAPSDVTKCVLHALQELTLDPPDQREGRIALTFKLESGQRKRTRPKAGPAD